MRKQQLLPAALHAGQAIRQKRNLQPAVLHVGQAIRRRRNLQPAVLHVGQAINKQPGGKVFPVNDYSLPGTGSEQSASAFIEKTISKRGTI